MTTTTSQAREAGEDRLDFAALTRFHEARSNPEAVVVTGEASEGLLFRVEPIIYIAGPMTGLPEFNYPAFHRAKAELEWKGFRVLSPATHTADVESGNADGEDKWLFYMRHALSLLIQAGAVALLPGWENSRGARIEHDLATKLGYEVAPLSSWLDA